MSPAQSSPKGKRPVEDPLDDVSLGSPEDETPEDFPEDDTPDDDEELPETDPDVVKLLGFDPLEEGE